MKDREQRENDRDRQTEMLLALEGQEDEALRLSTNLWQS